MPPPPSGPTNVLFDMWLLSRTSMRIIGEAVGQTGLSADEFGVYSLLAKGPLTPTELAAWIDAPATTVSSFVARFERRGHVRREPKAEDARSYRLALTPAGRTAYERAGAGFLTLLDRVEGTLGDERTVVQAALRQLRSALGDDHPADHAP